MVYEGGTKGLGYSKYPLVGAAEVFPRDSGTIWGYVGKKYGVIIFAKKSLKELKKTNLNRYIRGTPKKFPPASMGHHGNFCHGNLRWQQRHNRSARCVAKTMH